MGGVKYQFLTHRWVDNLYLHFLAPLLFPNIVFSCQLVLLISCLNLRLLDTELSLPADLCTCPSLVDIVCSSNCSCQHVMPSRCCH